MVIQDDGTCDACHACHNKANGHIDWALREKELRELCDEYRKNDGSYDCLVPGSGGKDSFLCRSHPEIQIRHAPPDGDLGTAYLHPLGLG